MRPSKPIPDPVTGKKTLNLKGISYHRSSRRYRIQHRKGDKWVNEYFPVTPEGLLDAKRRREHLDGNVPLIPALSDDAALEELRAATEGYVNPDHLTPDVIQEWAGAVSATDQKAMLIRLGVPEDDLNKNPEVLTHMASRGAKRVNPEWVKTIPKGKRKQAIADALGLPVTVAHGTPIGDTDHPNGERLTVQQVGELYREWYAKDKSNLQEAMNQAEAYNAVNTSSRPRTWLQYVPRRARQHYREHLKYYICFADFIGRKRTIDTLVGQDFRDYYNHVRSLAHGKTKPKGEGARILTNPNTWINKRMWAVGGAFRRVKRLYPDAAWARGLFGTDGLLAILEQRGTGREGKQVHITPEEFKALLDVADVQWKALLMLAFNCALKNSDMMLPWSAIDFDHELMIYPRPKTNRKRMTPLAPETLQSLREWKKHTPSIRAEIFVTMDGNSWVTTTDSLGKHWNLLKSKVEQKTGHRIPATFDSLRKTPASLLVEKGVANAKEAVQFLLGHRSKEAWRYYVGVAPDCLYPAIEVIRATYLV